MIAADRKLNESAVSLSGGSVPSVAEATRTGTRSPFRA